MSLRSKLKRGGYEVYRRVVPESLRGLPDARVFSDAYSADTSRGFESLMTSGSPMFVGRVGGSDYDAAADLFSHPHAFDRTSRYEAAAARVGELNGYFDFDNDLANFVRYLETLTRCYEQADALFYGGVGLITQFRHNAFSPSERKYLRHVGSGKHLMTWEFVEATLPFLGTFKRWGEGKRVLIVSPFSRSLQAQFARKNDLILGYQFPEFELLTYTSPVTYSTAGDSQLSLGIETRNWHEQCEVMARNIAGMEFDIAFLSCASYAMYLGDFIRHELGRSAVYTGGALNVMFNIYGERYDTPYFNSITNDATRIGAIENADIANLKAGWSTTSESLRAYFGKPRP